MVSPAVCLKAILMSSFVVLWVHAQDYPVITSNATTADVIDDDIAHFTCSARGQPTPSISWVRSGKDLTSSDKGVKILSKNSSSRLVISHLFVAVTDSDRRGEYVCVASNELGETERTFVILKDKSSTKLTKTDYIAIGISSGLTMIILGLIVVLLVKRVAEQRRTSKTDIDQEAHSNQVIEDSEEEHVSTAL